ncbi:hypothetical protein EFK50_14485 [Nocardioides marmoriginsengisoli]|uniref:Uncharacterized protein n=1 Tax=Nocardioides marmoriginsengisoli TaxID=661483 RepID=A0A3N0CHY4_9ACTN|nr:hypothetical protein [Nocardioides marmoriginsengisoli]RNL62929.1 hypothetical protein EFK50_14485 [Nocardioides marmoriginsengisoli]
MTALPSPHLLDTLGTAVDARLGADHPDRAFTIKLCAEAIGFSWILSRRMPDGHVGRRARTSAALLLELAFPEMRAGVRHQLSVACEIIATGAHVPLTD